MGGAARDDEWDGEWDVDDQTVDKWDVDEWDVDKWDVEHLFASERSPTGLTGMFEPGLRGLVIGGALMVLLVTMLLPHTGAASGWDVLLADADARAERIALPSRLFVYGALLFTVLLSAAALSLRRWALAWVATAGSAVTGVFGLLSVWSRQTVDATADVGGPGLGLLIGWVAVIVATFHWVRLVWSQIPATDEQRSAAFTPRLR